MFISRGNNSNYYHKTCRELGYVTTFASSEREYTDSTELENYKEIVEWNFDVSTSVVLKAFVVNMVYVSHEEPDNAWTHHMDIKWDIRFELR